LTADCSTLTKTDSSFLVSNAPTESEELCGKLGDGVRKAA
jgi:hypothetical protein